MNTLWFGMRLIILLISYEDNILLTLMKILLFEETINTLNITENYGSRKNEQCTVQLLKCCNSIDPI
jgi:NADH:ubiquinone oxidoreductase subunit H